MLVFDGQIVFGESFAPILKASYNVVFFVKNFLMKSSSSCNNYIFLL